MIVSKLLFLYKGLVVLIALWLCILVLSTIPIYGQTFPPPIILTDSQGEYPLGLHLELLDDPTGTLTLDQVTSAEYDNQFVASHEATPNFGFTTSTIWARFRVNNQSNASTGWRLALHDARMGLMDVYLPNPDSPGVKHKQAGRRLPFVARDVVHPYYVFDVTLPTQSEETIYMRFQSESGLTLPLTLWSVAALAQDDLTEILIMGIAAGTLFVMGCFSFFLFLSLRGSSYLYLSLFIASYLMLQLSRTGLAHQYLWPNWTNRYSIELFVSLTIIFGVLFSVRFLLIKMHVPWLYYGLIALSLSAGAIILLIPLMRWLNPLLNIVILLTMSALMLAACTTWWQGYRPARYYLIGLSMFFGVSALRIFGVFDLSPLQIISEKIPLLSFIFLILFLSLAMADRINIFKAETEQAHRSLAESERRLNQFLEAMPVGVVVHGLDTKLLYINERALQILNPGTPNVKQFPASAGTLEETLKKLPIYRADTNQQYPKDELPVVRALRGEFIHADNLELAHPDQRVPIETWSTPLFDQQGQIKYVISVFQDITERKLTEAELHQYRHHLEEQVSVRTAELTRANRKLRQEIDHRRQAQKELAFARDKALEASRFKTRLIAKVSHEFRTPLSAIIGFADLLKEEMYGPMSAEQKRVSTDIADNANTLNTLLNELLDQAQLEAGKLQLEIIPFSPAEVLAQVAASLKPSAAQKVVKLLTSIEPGLPDALEGDPERIRQIMANLIDNAIKFTEQGQVEVKLYCVSDSHWCIQVSDTGPGISVVDQATIFEPFRQVDDSATRRHRGYGLGLSIVKELTELMGGKISLDSQIGQGSTFTVQLPLWPPEISEPMSSEEKVA